MIHNRISRLMGERRLTISETARRAGLAYTTVHALFHDTVTRLDVDTLDALCRALEVSSVADLFEYAPDGARRAEEGTP